MGDVNIKLWWWWWWWGGGCYENMAIKEHCISVWTNGILNENQKTFYYSCMESLFSKTIRALLYQWSHFKIA